MWLNSSPTAVLQIANPDERGWASEWKPFIYCHSFWELLSSKGVATTMIFICWAFRGISRCMSRMYHLTARIKGFASSDQTPWLFPGSLYPFYDRCSATAITSHYAFFDYWLESYPEQIVLYCAPALPTSPSINPEMASLLFWGYPCYLHILVI